jgi:hypothetical protein
MPAFPARAILYTWGNFKILGTMIIHELRNPMNQEGRHRLVFPRKRLSSGLGEEDRPSLRTQVRTQVLHAFRGLVGTRKTIV